MTGCLPLPLLTPKHSCKTCGGPEAFFSPTTSKKCGKKHTNNLYIIYVCDQHTIGKGGLP